MTPRRRGPVGPTGLTRRQRRELAALGQQLAVEDPELAQELRKPNPARLRQQGARITLRLLWSGFALFLLAAVLDVQSLVLIACTVVLLCWLPAHLLSANSTPKGR
ncbi:DUF3040 domain-containing protein [Pseudonocardia sp. GCM10023141]|uniref:DUF3040 domain-containing protein n=1 Tax=Pseudonocardia sp. GCM10023141 TaxID=3252653 RepID=UPI003611E445